jgi:hypothetical protein
LQIDARLELEKPGAVKSHEEAERARI